MLRGKISADFASQCFARRNCPLRAERRQTHAASSWLDRAVPHTRLPATRNLGSRPLGRCYALPSLRLRPSERSSTIDAPRSPAPLDGASRDCPRTVTLRQKKSSLPDHGLPEKEEGSSRRYAVFRMTVPVWYPVAKVAPKSERPVGGPAALGMGGDGGSETRGSFAALWTFALSPNPQTVCLRLPAASIERVV